ncbi:MAG: hypothetical protein KC493_11280 [Bacteriovoracaceae bacterium]|nr:hypothetical protein [Bacteriovoracaceae bacterium]
MSNSSELISFNYTVVFNDSLTNKNISDISFPKSSGVIVTPVFIDKITLTIDIPLGYRDSVVSKMKSEGSYYRGATRRYRHLSVIPLNKKCLPHLYSDMSGESWLRIEAEPRDSYQNFMRFEWNPAKVDDILLPSVIEHFLPPNWTYKRLMINARITRIDITFDIVNLSIDELLFFSLRKSCSAVWNITKAKGGKTLYLGGERGNQKFSIYDKAQLIKKNNAKKAAELKESIPEQEITRVELIFKPDKGIKLQAIPSIANPFSDLKVYSSKVDEGELSDLTKQTLARARYEGLLKAIRALSKSNRTDVIKVLKSNLVDWWNADDIWAGMPLVISRLIEPVEKINSS